MSLMRNNRLLQKLKTIFTSNQNDVDDIDDDVEETIEYFLNDYL